MKAIVLAAVVVASVVTPSAQSPQSAPPAAALIAALAAPPAGATGSVPRAVVFPVGMMRAQMADSIAEAKAKGSAATVLQDYGTYRLMLWVLGRSSGAEVDAHWDDMMVVEQGGAILVTGGRVIGGRRDAQGEIRGLRIEGGQRQEIGAGDILTVRASTAHQLLLSPGTVCSAFIIQVHEH